MNGNTALEPADLARLDFAKGDGLLPAIVQNAESGAVLMLGFMNVQALQETFARGRVVFFSRSKQRLWEKGETSGHTLDVVTVHADCDNDTLLIRAIPRGPACHRGTVTCFGDEVQVRASSFAFLATLEEIVEERKTHSPESSYTARLHAEGLRRIAQKVGEEGVELALAAAMETDDKVVGEAADLLFHMTVLLSSRKLNWEQVIAELKQRHEARR